MTHSTEEIQKRFIGTWRLISCTETLKDGSVIHTWGEKANGYIIYTAEGIIAIQIMAPDRKQFHTTNIKEVSTEEAVALAQDYNAYFGRYEVDIKNQSIIHHVEGHLVPNFVGKPNIRRYEFKENRLSLITIGGSVYREILWERV